MTDTTKNRQRVDKDGVIHVQLPEVVIEAKDLLAERLLRVPDEYYYHNTRYWCDAIKYMRDTKNIEGERAIFMKRFNYGRAQWAKGVFAIIGGTVGIVLAVEAIAIAGISSGVVSTTATGSLSIARNLFHFGRVTTYYRMGINGLVQATIDPDGFRGINVVSLLAEGICPGLGALTAAIEYRPLRADPQQKFKLVGYNKTVSETLFDASVHFGAGRFSNGMSTYIKRMAEPGSVKALKHFAFPIYQSGYQFILQGGTQGIKETTGILKSNNNEMEK